MLRSVSARGVAVSLLGAAVWALGCSGSIGDAPGTGSTSGDPSSPGAGPGGGPSTNPVVPPVGAQCKAAPPLPARLWRLTHAQLKNTVSDTFGFTVPVLDTLPAESRLDGFANAAERLGLSSTLFQYYAQTAEDISSEVVKRGGFIKCAVEALGAGSCLADFLAGTGQKAWRRPLTQAEVARFTRLFTSASQAAGPEVGFRMVVQGLLLSPNFLFRTELGDKPGPDGTITLTDLELASALSYMLWDAPPDATLMGLAMSGKLHDRATLLTQARRLLASPERALPALASFVQQWFEAEDLTTKPKDTDAFPFFTPQLEKDMEEETRRFIQAVVFDPGGDRSLRTLLTAPYGYVNSRLAKLYGVPAPAGNDFVKTDLDPAQRRGLLTQTGFLASHAEPALTSPVSRGRFMREQVLCAYVPPPPGDFKFDEKIITDDMTAREKLTVHSKNPMCAACHSLFDGIGFALENYDALGQWRTTDKGKTIDPSGDLSLPTGTSIHFSNFIDMVDQLAKAPDPYDCFSTQFLAYATGQLKVDDCEREAFAKAFADAGYRLDALALAVVGSPGFAIRKN